MEPERISKDLIKAAKKKLKNFTGDKKLKKAMIQTFKGFWRDGGIEIKEDDCHIHFHLYDNRNESYNFYLFGEDEIETGDEFGKSVNYKEGIVGHVIRWRKAHLSCYQREIEYQSNTEDDKTFEERHGSIKLAFFYPMLSSDKVLIGVFVFVWAGGPKRDEGEDPGEFKGRKDEYFESFYDNEQLKKCISINHAVFEITQKEDNKKIGKYGFEDSEPRGLAKKLADKKKFLNTISNETKTALSDWKVLLSLLSYHHKSVSANRDFFKKYFSDNFLFQIEGLKETPDKCPMFLSLCNELSKVIGDMRLGIIHPYDAVKKFLKDNNPIWEDVLKLAEFEPVLAQAPDYREHFIHMFKVFLLGYCILDGGYKEYVEKSLVDELNDLLTAKFSSSYDAKNFFHKDIVHALWLLLATSHDVGYPIEAVDEWLKGFFHKFAEEADIAPFVEVSHLLLNKDFAKDLDRIAKIIASRILGRDENSFFETNQNKRFINRSVLFYLFKYKDHAVISSLFMYDSLKKLFGSANTQPNNIMKAIVYNRWSGTNPNVREAAREYFALNAAVPILLHNIVNWFEVELDPNGDEIDKCNLPNVSRHSRLYQFFEESESCSDFLNYAKNFTLDPKKFPLTTLLIYCDLLQEDGRPRYVYASEKRRCNLFSIKEIKIKLSPKKIIDCKMSIYKQDGEEVERLLYEHLVSKYLMKEKKEDFRQALKLDEKHEKEGKDKKEIEEGLTASDIKRIGRKIVEIYNFSKMIKKIRSGEEDWIYKVTFPGVIRDGRAVSYSNEINKEATDPD